MKEGKNNSRRPEKLEIWLFSMKSSQTSSFQVKISEQKGLSKRRQPASVSNI